MINITKKQLIIISSIAVIIIFIIGYYIYSMTITNDYEELEQSFEKENIIQENNNIKEAEEIIVIHIAGQIKNPGIVRIKEGARIADVIEQAGGLTQDADITTVNLAYVIEDGQKITIPSKNSETVEEKEYITTRKWR